MGLLRAMAGLNSRWLRRPASGNIPPPCWHPIEDVAAFLFGYLCGSISVRCADHPLAPARRMCAPSARAISAPTNVFAHRPKKASPRRRFSATCSRVPPAVTVANALFGGEAAIVTALAPFSATCCRSGSVLRAARAWQRFIGLLLGFGAWPALFGLRRSLARRLAALTAIRRSRALSCQRGDPAVRWWSAKPPDSELRIVSAVAAAALDHAPRQHRSAHAGTEGKLGSRSDR